MEELLNNARIELESLNKSDIAEMKSFKNPPDTVMKVMTAIMILLRMPTTSWKAATSLLSTKINTYF